MNVFPHSLYEALYVIRLHLIVYSAEITILDSSSRLTGRMYIHTMNLILILL